MPTSDGHIILAVGNDGQFRKLCSILKLEGVADDDRFATNRARVANRDEVRRLVTAATASISKAELLDACEREGVPAGPINSIAETFDDPQVKARGLRVDLPDADGNLIPGVRTPIVFSGTPLVYDRPSPRLGEHTEAVLAELATLESGKKSA